MLPQHLDWSAKQSRILTDSGNALNYYTSSNGYPFSSDELPHHHLERGDSHAVFQQWARNNNTQSTLIKQLSFPIVGAWKRPLFAGKWEHSTSEEETVYNVQTRTLFVDLRIPKCKPGYKWEAMGMKLLLNNVNDDDSNNINNSNNNNNINGGIMASCCRQVLENMSDDDLRLYARQHVFGGFSVIQQHPPTLPPTNNKNMQSLPVCTRHHCIDWNYIPQKSRPRPNKWYIEGNHQYKDGNDKNNDPFNVWKEWSYATDFNGQCYYWEQWERIEGDEMGRGLRVALRKRRRDAERDDDNYVDGILVVVGVSINTQCATDSIVEMMSCQ